VGLTLAREVIHRMGGNIFVKSEKGLGSEFGFSLPYRPAGSRKMFGSYENTVTIPDWSAHKCLIIDNNRDMLIYLTRTLQETGIKIISAKAGFEALQIVKLTPDIRVVLIDMQMPEVNGMEITKEIRKLRPELPIIAQTAFLFENDKDIIIEAGCTAFLIKPFKREQLVSAMGRFLDPGGSGKI
jgi:CheY-like chemotaxis protein